jgi:hypothetical protein
MEPSTVTVGEAVAVTVYATNFEEVPVTLKLYATSANLTFSSTEIAHPAGEFDRFTVTIPAGAITSPATFDISALATTTCRVSAPAMLTVVGTSTFTLASVAPNTATTTTTTQVTITATTEVFAQTALPSVFLVDSSLRKATPLSHVAYKDLRTLTASIPSGAFTAGIYDVVVASAD